MNPTRADVCAVACADLFAADGEILASPMGTMPLIGARLARLTSNLDLVLSDGEAYLLAETPPVGGSSPLEGWLPYRKVFDVVASGTRHVVMGANQIDRFGNQNISCLGDHA
ncbi:MAG: CoA-transferase, partial [Jatrophihabitans sp.]